VEPPVDPLSVVEPGDEAAAAKRALRDLVLGRRDAMAGDERRAAGAALRARLTAVPTVADASAVFCFASFRSEIDTAPFISWCLARGVAVGVPRIVGPHHMEAFAVGGERRDLAPGSFGIPEPRAGLPPVEPAAFDVVIVPGSAFDREGGRMGYGGGFYDTFLARMRADAERIGICFDLQVVDRVPREPHDLCVDLIVTETRTIATGCRQASAER
jgi:5-formyltetrahydrofolate cyclo-ligase